MDWMLLIEGSREEEREGFWLGLCLVEKKEKQEENGEVVGEYSKKKFEKKKQGKAWWKTWSN